MKALIFTFVIVFLSSVSFGQNWNAIKETTRPVVEIPAEFDTLYRQPLSGLGWEDGLHISEDGLNLYCTYVPIDFLSFVLNEDLPNNFSSRYLRGALTFGMDLMSNPLGESEWLHSDILYSHGNSPAESFEVWQLSTMSRKFYSEGAPSPTFSTSTNTIELMLFASNDNATNNSDIWIIENTTSNPAGTGSPMSAPVNTTYNEDNPHLTRISGDTLVLFFDSDNLPGGMGSIDIWFSVSLDNGNTWHTPSNVTTVSSSGTEHQPFLHEDLFTNKRFLYYSAFHTDGKLAIYRSEQLIANDWDSWGNAELVISAGNSAGIGEPTLTKNGDISFVIVYEDPDMNATYDRFDSDPWFLRKKVPVLAINQPNDKSAVSIYPNPSTNRIFVDTKKRLKKTDIYSHRGALLHTTTNTVIDINDFPKGIYLLTLYFESGTLEYRRIAKE